MATTKTPAPAPAAAPTTTQAPTGAAPAPAVDPGPPPPMPAPPNGTWPFGIDRLIAAARLRERETIHAIQTIRLGPEVAKYKAELLAWLDALEKHEAKLK